MENASKALLMSAGILIGVVILSLGVYLYGSFSSSTSQMEHQIELDQINNFNSRFLAYDGKEELTIYDIYTVANLAEESNKNYQVYGEGLQTGSLYIAVFIDGDNGKSKGYEDDTSKKFSPSNFLNTKTGYAEKFVNASGKEEVRLKKYKCEVKINNNTRRVNKIIFTYKKSK